MADNNALKALKEERSAVSNGIANTQAHLKRLQEKLEALDKAISNLEPFYEKGPEWRAIASALLGEETPGITDAVRMIFSSHADIYLEPTAVRDALKKDGLIKGYDNEMAVIHQVIRRLEDQKQLEAHPVEKAYRWKPGNVLKDLASWNPVYMTPSSDPITTPSKASILKRLQKK